MAKNHSTVFLGFLDEAISTKYQHSTDHTTNKLGGTPNFPVPGITVSNCPICALKRPLLLQIYAPLDNSVFDRTLFIFGCLNPSCSTQSKSWLCIRSQVMEKPKERDGRDRKKREESAVQINWCSGADDWGMDGDNDDGVVGAGSPPETLLDNDQFVKNYQRKAVNDNEENGNSIVAVDNYRQLSDEDDESTSTTTAADMLSSDLNMMQIDEDNANCNSGAGANVQMDGAVGPMCPLKNQASAEIEGGEEKDNLITIDKPISPQRDLIALLKQTSALITDSTNSLTLNSYFLYVEEELGDCNQKISEHVRDLIQEYQKKDESVNKTPDSPNGKEFGGVADTESYEKAAPAHGDVLFHTFLMKIQENPGQILRYSRSSSPLLISKLTDAPEKCIYCGAEQICELQLLPTIIPSLTLECNGEGVPIEFGNVLIFTCAKSCWDTPDKSRQEVCIVQREM